MTSLFHTDLYRFYRAHIREDGQFQMDIEERHAIFEGIDGDSTTVLLTHGDSVGLIAKNYKVPLFLK